MGDEAFFAKLGRGAGEPSDDWGEFEVSGGRWERERFERCATSTEPRERRELFDALVKSWFGAYTKTSAFVDVDAGLAEMARHAAELGYAGIVLFLDER